MDDGTRGFPQIKETPILLTISHIILYLDWKPCTTQILSGMISYWVNSLSIYQRKNLLLWDENPQIPVTFGVPEIRGVDHQMELRRHGGKSESWYCRISRDSPWAHLDRLRTRELYCYYLLLIWLAMMTTQSRGNYQANDLNINLNGDSS